MPLGPFHKRHMMITTVFACNSQTYQYVRQMLTELKGEMSVTTVLVGNVVPQFQQWIYHADQNPE